MSAFLRINYIFAESQDKKIAIFKDFEMLFIFLLLNNIFMCAVMM